MRNRTPHKILKDCGIEADKIQKEKPMLYDNMRMAMDEFAEQYADWKLGKAKDVQAKTNLQMKKYIKKDKHGNEIKLGDRFKFKYLKELNDPIELIGSFDWNDDELRYDIDIHDNETYICLCFIGNGIMFDFELL